MGCYISLPTSGATRGRAQREWLQRHGTELPGPPAWATLPPDCLPVCLVDNITFMAAGVAFDELELQRFVYGRSGRAWTWFLVPRKKLYAVSPLDRYEAQL